MQIARNTMIGYQLLGCGRDKIKMNENKNRKEMKRKVLAGMLIIYLVLGAVSVGCVNGIVSAENTPYKKILFDESHHQSCSIDACLTDFAKELSNNHGFSQS